MHKLASKPIHLGVGKFLCRFYTGSGDVVLPIHSHFKLHTLLNPQNHSGKQRKHQSIISPLACQIFLPKKNATILHNQRHERRLLVIGNG
jgi:hypothetical protein